MTIVLIPSQTGKHSNKGLLLTLMFARSLNPFSNRETFKHIINTIMINILCLNPFSNRETFKHSNNLKSRLLVSVLIPSQTGKHSNHA